MWSHNPDTAEALAREQRAAREAEAARYRTLAGVRGQRAGRWARTMQGVGEWMEGTGRRLQARYNTHSGTMSRKEHTHAAAARTQPV